MGGFTNCVLVPVSLIPLSLLSPGCRASSTLLFGKIQGLVRTMDQALHGQYLIGVDDHQTKADGHLGQGVPPDPGR